MSKEMCEEIIEDESIGLRPLDSLNPPKSKTMPEVKLVTEKRKYKTKVTKAEIEKISNILKSNDEFIKFCDEVKKCSFIKDSTKASIILKSAKNLVLKELNIETSPSPLKKILFERSI
jgi:hypothetical protein